MTYGRGVQNAEQRFNTNKAWCEIVTDGALWKKSSGPCEVTGPHALMLGGGSAAEAPPPRSRPHLPHRTRPRLLTSIQSPKSASITRVLPYRSLGFRRVWVTSHGPSSRFIP